MARDIFSPLERMTHTMERVQKGDLDARIGPMGAANEIGEVAAHLDRAAEPNSRARPDAAVLGGRR